MKIKEFFKNNLKKARRNWSSWSRIKNPPKWVVNAGGHVEVKASHDPFRMHWTRLKGNSYLYKVVAENTGQGTCKTKYYRKVRIR